MSFSGTTEHDLHMRTPTLLDVLLELDDGSHYIRAVNLDDEWYSSLRQ